VGLLHNPRYAGAFVYGRTRQRKVSLQGQARYRVLPRAEWKVFLPDAHPAYISWEEFESNQAKLLQNAHAVGGGRRRSPAREGAALLQGLVLCSRCGLRMTVRYQVRQGTKFRTMSASGKADRRSSLFARGFRERASTKRLPRGFWNRSPPDFGSGSGGL
jgi:recombinase